VPLGDRTGDGQPEPGATRTLGDERLEYALALIGAYTRPLIADLDEDDAAAALQEDAHGRVLGRELDGVEQDVAERTPQRAPRSDHRGRRQRVADGDVARIGVDAGVVGDDHQQLFERDRLALALLSSGQIRQLLEELALSIERPGAALGMTPLAFVGRIEQRQRQRQGRERLVEVMHETLELPANRLHARAPLLDPEIRRGHQAQRLGLGDVRVAAAIEARDVTAPVVDLLAPPAVRRHDRGQPL
jgi:hypothetical protein